MCIVIHINVSGGGICASHVLREALVNTAVSKLESVLFVPLQGFPCLGSLQENAADEALKHHFREAVRQPPTM